jgi:hypothetical protein
MTRSTDSFELDVIIRSAHSGESEYLFGRWGVTELASDEPRKQAWSG